MATIDDKSLETSPDKPDAHISVDITANTGSENSANEERIANVAADEDAAVAELAQADSQTEALAVCSIGDTS